MSGSALEFLRCCLSCMNCRVEYEMCDWCRFLGFSRSVVWAAWIREVCQSSNVVCPIYKLLDNAVLKSLLSFSDGFMNLGLSFGLAK